VNIDESVISWVVRFGDITTPQQSGVSALHFVDEYRTVWKYLCRVKRDHDTVPSSTTLRTRFPDLNLGKVRQSEWPLLLSQLRQRKKFIDFLEGVDQAVSSCTSHEQVEESIQMLMGKLNELTFDVHQRSHIVDVFSRDHIDEFAREVQRRRSGEVHGIPTGLKRFDDLVGGLQSQKMYTIIGRPGLGKSWLDLLFVAMAVLAGKKVILYPLEMTLFDTAARLYTIFTQQMWGSEQVLKNYDLTQGKVTKRKVVRFLHALEDKFEGQLYVADVAQLADPYTTERIEAEVEAHKPDMFWVDYLTLLKPPPGSREDGTSDMVRRLSNGIKNCAARRNVVGGASAQVNREAMRVRAFLPRLEHIAYGDAIGQDVDGAFSINRRGNHLHWALVKHRGGPEIGTNSKHGVKCKFFVNEGIIEEVTDDEEDDE
jgi:replicative DNA helicase